MAKLQDHADLLQQENDCLWARLEEDRGENTRGSNHLAPSVKQNRGKEPIQLGGSDARTDDELPFGSSLLLDLLPPKNNVEVKSRKRCSSRFVSGMHHRV